MSNIFVYNKTAPRLLQDITEYDPEASYYSFFSSEPQNGRCRHVFHENSHRFAGPSLEGETPGQNTRWAIALTCEHCRLHVDVAIEYTPGGGSCVLSFNDAAPLHHFCFDPTDNEFRDELPRDYNLCCSYEHCRAKVSVSVRQPVIRGEEVNFLTTTARARSKAQGEYREPLSVLKGYSKQVLEGKARRIPMKNPRFSLALGVEASDLLRRLGASYDQGSAADGEDDGWLPPQLGSHDLKQLMFDRQRRTVEDADHELAFLIAMATNTSFAPPPSYRSFEHILGCLKYSKVTTTRRPEQGADAGLQVQAYKCLGAIADFSNDLIVWCFDKQATTDPSQRALYFDSIKTIARDRSAEVLDMKVVTLQSQGFATMDELDAAYRTIGIDPRHATQINDQMILSTYHGRYPDSGPSQQVEMRKAMQVIATYRGSSQLQEVVKDAVETYGEALQWLGVDQTTEHEFVWAAKVNKDVEDPSNKDKTTRAVEIIQRETDSILLASHLREQNAESSKPPLSKADALLTLNLSHLIAQPFTAEEVLLAVFSFTDAPADQKAEVARALERVNEDLNDGTIKSTIDDFRKQAMQPVLFKSLEAPRGLTNRGNTCYLAALLQLIYTIIPVRRLTEVIQSDPSAATVNRRLEKPYQLALKLADLFHTLATSRQEAVALDVELAAASLESDPESNKELELEKRRRSTVGASSRPSIMSLPMEPTNEEGEALQQVQSPTADVSMFGSAQPSQETAANIRPTADEPMTTESQQDQAMKDAPGEPPQPTVEARQKQVAEWERQNDMREVLHTTYSKLDKASKLSPGLGAMHELRDFNRLIQIQDTTHTAKANKSGPSRDNDQIKFLLLKTQYDTEDFHSLIEKNWGYWASDQDTDTKDEKIHTFTNLPPVLHVEVSSGADYDSVNKFQPDLRIHSVPERLSMDRYQDDQDLLKRRRKFTNNLFKLDALYKARTAMSEPGLDMKDGGELLNSVYAYLEQIKDVPGVADGVEDDFVIALKQLADNFPTELQHVHDSIRSLEHEQAELFPEDKRRSYRLHAVVNHHGTSNVSGHYTIYIYDAAGDQWYYYNDDRVEPMSSNDEVLDPSKHPDNMGNVSPSLLVYVKIDQAEELVQTVCRQPDPAPDSPQEQQQQPQMQQAPYADDRATMQAPYRSSPEHAIHGKPVRKSGSTDESEVPQREHGLLTPSESPDEEGTYALTRQFAHQPAGATCLELDFMQFAPFGGGKPICPVETDPKPIMIQDIERWLSAADTGKRKRNKYSDGR